jgi:hypothetical protein
MVQARASGTSLVKRCNRYGTHIPIRSMDPLAPPKAGVFPGINVFSAVGSLIARIHHGCDSTLRIRTCARFLQFGQPRAKKRIDAWAHGLAADSFIRPNAANAVCFAYANDLEGFMEHHEQTVSAALFGSLE